MIVGLIFLCPSQPLYGTVAPPPSFLPAHHTGEVDLLEAALGSPLDGRGLPQPLSVSATWLAVEGVSVSGEGGEGGLLEPGSIEIKRPQIEVQFSVFTMPVHLHGAYVLCALFTPHWEML